MGSARSLLWFSAKRETEMEKKRGSRTRRPLAVRPQTAIWFPSIHPDVPDPFRPPSLFPKRRQKKERYEGNATSRGRWQKYGVCINVMVPAVSRKWRGEIKRTVGLPHSGADSAQCFRICVFLSCARVCGSTFLCVCVCMCQSVRFVEVITRVEMKGSTGFNVWQTPRCGPCCY